MKHLKDQKGFTLVELAIVMIIIGLLIGGILKGQELITNAEVAATVTQVKGIDAAVTTFRDSYNAMPGDMDDASTRLPDCDDIDVCADSPNNSNSRIDDQDPDEAAGEATTENVLAWVHLAVADLIGGVDTSTDEVAFGSLLPETELDGGYRIAYWGGGDLTGTAADNSRAGHYLTVTLEPGDNVGFIGAQQSARIDRKLDDGAPASGTVVAFEGAGDGDAGCISDGGDDGADTYDEQENPAGCGLYIRIQQ